MKSHIVHKSCAILFCATMVVSCQNDPGDTTISTEPQDTIWAQSSFPEGWGVSALGVTFGYHIYTGTYDGATGYKTFRSTDRGNSWEEPGSRLTGTAIRGIVNQSDGNVFAVTNGNPGLSRSVDSGQTWIDIGLNDVGSGLST